MKQRKFWVGCLLLAAILAGCAGKEPVETTVDTEPTETVEQTLPAPVMEADGDPESLLCKASYTVSAEEMEETADAVAAVVGDAQLTNSQLQVWYWMEVAAYQQAGYENGPDFSQPLDSQICKIAETEMSWQQYFLQKALDAWHSNQALLLHSVDVPLPTEAAYGRDQKLHDKYIVGKPATSVLYGYTTAYKTNDLHQAWLNEIPAMLEALAAELGYADTEAMAQALTGAGGEALEAWAELYNRGYMYFTTLTYYHTDVTAEETESYLAANPEVSGLSGKTMDIRQILLIPEDAQVAEDGTVTCSEESWQACLDQAYEILDKHRSTYLANEGTFANLAYQYTDDEGSKYNGGLYSGLQQGQLIPELDAWCFEDGRQSGDTQIIRTDYGCHILFIVDIQSVAQAEAEAALIYEKSAALISDAKQTYPVSVDFSKICLTDTEGETGITVDDVLYPDIGHERYTCAPLYLQQDYPTAEYGTRMVKTHGCGVTTMAMLATYMTDTDLTPPILASRYGYYCSRNGTSRQMFEKVPSELGFYLKKSTTDWEEARAAMEEGYIVVNLQAKGYWTTVGHYLLLEKLTEDGLVQVRDSNLLNYYKLKEHQVDAFGWETLYPNDQCYWIYEKKLTNVPTCVRCGQPEDESVSTGFFTEDYYCEKCGAATTRRDNFLAIVG